MISGGCKEGNKATFPSLFFGSRLSFADISYAAVTRWRRRAKIPPPTHTHTHTPSARVIPGGKLEGKLEAILEDWRCDLFPPCLAASFSFLFLLPVPGEEGARGLQAPHVRHPARAYGMYVVAFLSLRRRTFFSSFFQGSSSILTRSIFHFSLGVPQFNFSRFPPTDSLYLGFPPGAHRCAALAMVVLLLFFLDFGLGGRHSVRGDPQHDHHGHVRNGGRLLSSAGCPGASGRGACCGGVLLCPALHVASLSSARLGGPAGRALIGACDRPDGLPGLSTTCRPRSSWRWPLCRSWCPSWLSFQATRRSPSASS